MSEIQNILKRFSSLDIAPAQSGYSGVAIYAGEDEDGKDIVYRAGSMDGLVFEISNGWGSQEQAERIWAQIQGFQYQPYKAEGAMMDPAAEIGDGVNISDIYSGVFVRATRFGRLMESSIQAPGDQEIEHEFAVVSPSSRQYTRFTKQVRAMLSVTSSEIRAEVEARTAADEAMSSSIVQNARDITAKVSNEDKNSANTFGWKLNTDRWEIFSESGTILKATRGGLEVTGKITANEGYIGGTAGFTIKASKIYNGISSFSSKSTKGIYIGTDGINIGGKFKVDSSGRLTASSGTFSGNIKAANLQGTIPSSAIGDNSINKGKLSASVGTSLSRADTAAKVLSGEKKASAIYASTIFGEVGGSKVVLSFNTVDGKRLVGWNYI